MKEIEIKQKKLIEKSITKMVADKEAVKAYIKGGLSMDELKVKGIKFAKPL